MKNFIVYHKEGPLHPISDGSFFVTTTKSVNHILGNQIWLISGHGASPKEYRLEYVFRADEVESIQGKEKRLIGKVGTRFFPSIVLNGYDWFKSFQRDQLNFRGGLSPIQLEYENHFHKLRSDSFASGQSEEVDEAMFYAQRYAAEELEAEQGHKGLSDTERISLVNRLLAIDEFHHVSSNPDSILGTQLTALIARDKVHVVAMTGSYFRGDSEAVLSPADEAKFETVTYTYYEQLNGYTWLKSLDIGYFFYTGPYVDAIHKVLNPSLKTIVHIPNVNARESLKDKQREVDEIMHGLGEWKGVDPSTGFHQIVTADGRTLKIADLVDDSDQGQRTRVLTALKDPAHKNDRNHVDIIIALGMAKEGFDWIWCEHALTVGYRSSLTEIVQIIGRATRDAQGKTSARFTNLIAEPAASQDLVTEAVNDMLKAISASLLMEQVLAPRYEFTPKNAGPKEGFDYGPEGYQADRTNVGVNEATGQYHVEINGLATPQSKEATRICKEDLNEVVTTFLQDKTSLEQGLFDKEHVLPQELTQLRMGKIVRERYPDLSEQDQEAIRQHAVAAMNVTQQAKLELSKSSATNEEQTQGSTALLDGVRKFVNVRELDIELIDEINPFDAAYAVLAKSMDEKLLRQVQATIEAKKVSISEDDARDLAKRALQFKLERGRLPDINSADAWEKRMAEGVAALARYRAQAKAAEAKNSNG